VFTHQPRQKGHIRSRQTQAQPDLPHTQPARDVVTSTAPRRPTGEPGIQRLEYVSTIVARQHLWMQTLGHRLQHVDADATRSASSNIPSSPRTYTLPVESYDTATTLMSTNFCAPTTCKRCYQHPTPTNPQKRVGTLAQGCARLVLAARGASQTWPPAAACPGW
jgi:hypothetical protein